jgi:hypothetical protein
MGILSHLGGDRIIASGKDAGSRLASRLSTFNQSIPSPRL